MVERLHVGGGCCGMAAVLSCPGGTLAALVDHVGRGAALS
jgi:hypothetical protein